MLIQRKKHVLRIFASRQYCFLRETLKFVRNLRTIVGVKLCHTLFRGLILAMLVELLQFLKVSAQTFFSCSRYTWPSTKHGYRSGLKITLYF